MFLIINLIFASEVRETAKATTSMLPTPVVEIEKLNAIKINPIAMSLLGKFGTTYERANIWNNHSLEFNIGGYYKWLNKYAAPKNVDPTIYGFYLTIGPKFYYNKSLKVFNGFYAKPSLFVHYDNFSVSENNVKELDLKLWSSGIHFALGYQKAYDQFLHEVYLGIDLGYAFTGSYKDKNNNTNLSQLDKKIDEEDISGLFWVATGFMKRVKMDLSIGYRLGLKF